MKKCQSCNFENTDTMRFCVECGAPLPEAPFVVNLGGGAPPSGVNTAEYGKSSETQAAGKGAFAGNFPQQNFSNVPPPKKSGKKAFLIIGGIAALFLLIFAAGAAIVGYNMFIKDDIAEKTPTPGNKDFFTPSPTSTTSSKSPSPTKSPDDSPTPSDDDADGKGRAEVERVWVDYNIKEKGKAGMRVHVSYTVHELKGTDAYLAIYFAKEDGEKLLTNNKTYRSKDGQVAVFYSMKPGFDDAVYKDTKLFVPYDEFNLDSGTYDLKMDIDVIYESGDLFKHLQFYDFVYTEP
jgi:hypothetical protein